MKRFLILAALSAASLLAQPAITAVVDGAAYTNNIAQGSVFVVKGTGLSVAGLVQATPPTYPTTLNNVKISLTPVTAGAVINALMVNTFNQGGVNQVVAVLPSSAAPGAYDLRLDNNGAASAPFRTSVVARKPGIVTASSDGAGIAQATLDGKLILQRNTAQGKIGDFDTRPAKPGERVDLWGTGLGPDLVSDTGGTSGDQTTTGQIRVLVNGLEITPLYAGRSQGFPGLDQIAFTLPTATALNCLVDIQVRTGTVLSNPVTIATATGTACLSSSVRINEVESNGGTPGDWVEFYNSGTTPVSLAGYIFRDNDDTHAYTLPASAVVPAGGYLQVEEADFGFGLGTPDAARLFRPDGTLFDSYNWTPHATTTYGRCPSGTGPMVTTNSSTKGAKNDCGSPIRINEIESDAGTPGDWVELFNPSAVAVDVSGFAFRDNDDTHTYLIPSGTMIAAGGYLVLEEAQLAFGLGSADSARLFDATGALVDSYVWTAHAATTYGRCPNGSGAFVATTASTKGAVNACPGDVTFSAFPGGATIETVDNTGVFGGNLSGLTYEASAGGGGTDVLWGARNGPGSIFRLVPSGNLWIPDTSNSWGSGKALRYPNGTGDPDAEGITLSGTGSAGGVYVSTERDNSNNAISRNAILRFDASAPGNVLTATHDWNLTADLPSNGANLGMEAITYVPDSYLTSKNFFDESKNHAYNPGEYPNHNGGLFFIGIEATGIVYAYALDHSGNGAFTKIATIQTGLGAVMDLQFDRDTNDLFAVCDDTCQGRFVVLRPDATGKFTVAKRYERPTGMPNLNNEGFAVAPASKCAAGVKPVFWSDDSETGGHSIRKGTITCSPLP